MVTREEIRRIDIELREEINRLDVEIEKTKADIIKWMFLFWIGQLASLIVRLQIFFRK